MTELSPATREALLRVGTSTLTGILSRRGLRNMFLQDVWPIRPDLPRMVGLAFTMRFIPFREDRTVRGSLQKKAMEECPAGHVLVVDARGDARAASAGDLFVGRLKARGCAGIVMAACATRKASRKPVYRPTTAARPRRRAASCISRWI
jgi:regulator of RNase E activity RraA